MDQLNELQPTDALSIRKSMDRANLLIPNNELNEEHLGRIIYSVRHGMITTSEKVQLLMHIVTRQLETGFLDEETNKIRYLIGISNLLHSPCKHCKGLGFITVPEVEKIFVPCPGNPKYQMVSCNGSGIKTTICNRCNGMTLKEILDIRNGIMAGIFTDSEAGRNIIEKYQHFTKLRINKLTDDFVNKNGDKTFIVVVADNGKYCFIPRNPCTACRGTGLFVHDRKGIRCTCGGNDDLCGKCHGKGTYNSHPIICTACGGKGHLEKKLIMTGKVRNFYLCDTCHGEGQHNLGNPVINIKTMSDEVRKGLEHFFKNNEDNYVFKGNRSEAAEKIWFQDDPNSGEIEDPGEMES